MLWFLFSLLYWRRTIRIARGGQNLQKWRKFTRQSRLFLWEFPIQICLRGFRISFLNWLSWTNYGRLLQDFQWKKSSILSSGGSFLLPRKNNLPIWSEKSRYLCSWHDFICSDLWIVSKEIPSTFTKGSNLSIHHLKRY